MYGITQDDIKAIDAKIDKQKLFLSIGHIDIVGSNKKLIDNTYSANINPKKYFAEINNRVNTMFNNAKEKGLRPVFVTLTAPSKYHRKDKDGIPYINPNETAKALTGIWNKFTNLQVFQRMKKELGHGLIYFRVYEPHKSSVPHLHAMIFIPATYVHDVRKKYEEYFSSTWGANKNAIDFKYTWSNEKGGAVGYIMKYITKTFKDEDNLKTQHAVYWYIKHKVRRFLSSRTLAPLSIYRKVRYYFKDSPNDYLAVSKKLASGVIKKLFGGTQILYIYYNHDIGEVEEKILWGKNTELLLKDRASKELEKVQEQRQRENISLKPKRKLSSSIFVYENDIKKYTLTDDGVKELPIIPSRLKDYQLYKYYQELCNKNIDEVNTQHFLLTQNEAVRRGLIEGEIMSLNDTKDELGF